MMMPTSFGMRSGSSQLGSGSSSYNINLSSKTLNDPNYYPVMLFIQQI